MDKESATIGVDFEKSFREGIFSSAIMVCLLSREAINSSSEPKRNIANLSGSALDWVVLEWRLAVDLFELGQLHSIVPIFIGDKIGGNPTQYSDYFNSNCGPKVEEGIIVEAIESKVEELLRKEGLGCTMQRNDLHEGMSVKSIHNFITKKQGLKVSKIGSDDNEEEMNYESAIALAGLAIIKIVTAVNIE